MGPAAAAPLPPVVSAWGAGGAGQLGNASTSNSSTPVGVSLPSASAIAGGGSHSLAVLPDGGIRSWGSDGAGQLGNGSPAANSSAPVAVSGISNGRSVAAGATHSLATLADGSVRAWGSNFFGQVGDNTTSDRHAPVATAVAIPTGAGMVAAGNDHSLAVANDGRVWAWGSNQFGQLGQGSTSGPGPSVPTLVPGLSDIRAVAAGGLHSMALRADGTVFTWGRNSSGQLGRNCPFGTCLDSFVPTAISGLGGVVAIAGGGSFSLALGGDGRVAAWGQNSSGQLGDGTTTQRNVPTPVPALTGVWAISGGSTHSLAATYAGQVYAWGANGSGQLGDGTTAPHSSPAPVTGLSGVSAVAGGSAHSLATRGEPFGGGLGVAELRGVLAGCALQLPCTGGHAAHPVHTGTGNFWETYTDLSLPGRGPALNITRTYNSSAAGINGDFGYGWSWTYGMRLTTTPTGAVITGEQGNEVSFALEAASYVPSAPRYAATLVDNGSTFTFTRRNTEIFTFDEASGRLTKVEDRNGDKTEIFYDSATSWRIVDDAGRTVTLTLSGGRITGASDPSIGRSVTYAYTDGNGNLNQVTDVTGGVTTFTYDASHRLETIRQPAYADAVAFPNAKLVNTYDPGTGRVTSQTDPVGRTTFFDYSPSGFPAGTTKITDPKGNLRYDTYAFGMLVAQQRGSGAGASAWRYAYDLVSVGRTAVLDPNGHVTTATYDAAGNRTSVTDGLGRKTTFAYNAFNQLTSSTDPSNIPTTLTYDGDWGPNAGNLIKRSMPLLDPVGVQETEYFYGDAANPSDVTTVIDPDNHEWGVEYDESGYPDVLTDPLDHVTTRDWDAAGRLLTEVSARGNIPGGESPTLHTTTFTYDADNLLTGVTDPLGQGFSRDYDANRRLDLSIDANLNPTDYQYNAANELTRIDRAGPTELEYTYWPDGTLRTQEDGDNNVTEYFYDSQGRLTQVDDPLDGPGNERSVFYGYYPGGELRFRQDPSGNCSTPTNCTTYTYDAADQLKGIDYSDATPDVTAIGYDANGRRTSMTDGTGTSTWAWDSLGRLRSHTSGASVPGGALTTAYTHDLRNNVTSIDYPGSGSDTLTRHTDPAGSLAWVQDWTSRRITFGYDADDNLRTRTFPAASGLLDTLTPDRADRVTDMVTTKGAATLASFAYGRDDAGQVDSVTTAGQPGLALDDHSYGYTPLNQLEDVDALSYAYDPADNLTGLLGGRSQAFDDANQLASSATAQPSATTWGNPGDVPVPGDYDGDGRADVAIFRPSSGTWYLQQSSAGTSTVAYGAQGDIPVPADYDGDGKADVAIFRPAVGLWAIHRSSDGTDVFVTYGIGTDIPVPADYDGDAKADIAIFRPQFATWWVRHSSTGADVPTTFGIGTDTPVPADYDGDGKADIAVFRDGTWFTLPSSGGSYIATAHGASGDIPVPGDYDGDGRADVAVYRPSSGAWLLQQTTAGFLSTTWGISGDDPVAADYDRDGRDDIAVYRPSVGTWYVAASTIATFTYDTRGNRSSTAPSYRASQAYGYDRANRLTTAPGASYAYNGDGLRLSKTVSGTPTSFYWDHSGGLPMLLRENSGTAATRYIYGPGGVPVADVDASNNIRYHHSDQLGSARMLTNASGGVLSTFTYDPYGRRTKATGTARTPLGFASEYTDAETGFQYLRARYYDPLTGQFLTRDPITAATQEPYGYVGGNPLNSVDPSGNLSMPALLTGTVATLEVAASAYDAINLLGVLGNSCASVGDVVFAVGGFGLGIFGPGGGYGNAPRTADDLLPGLPSSAPRPLGLGSTGRTAPTNLTEQLAMTEVRAAPGGRVLPVTMTDARWPASAGWVKVSQRVNGVEIHYVRNTVTGAVDDFKLVGSGG